MPLVQAKCTNCGGILQVENDKEAAICPFCQTPYVVEKAINNYRVCNQFSINNSEVHIHNSESYDEKYESANCFLAVHKDYRRAEELFNELVAKTSNDYRGWWGLIRVKTKEFTCFGVTPDIIQKLTVLADSAFKVCNDDFNLGKIRNQWFSYKNSYDNLYKMNIQRESLRKDILKNKSKYERSYVFLILGIAFILFSILSLVIVRNTSFPVEGAAVFFIVIGICFILESKTAKWKKNLDTANNELTRINHEMAKIDPYGTFL